MIIPITCVSKKTLFMDTVKLRVLKVVFDIELSGWEIPLFRAAIIEKTGKEHLNFHNHLNKEQYLFGYPVIQYKIIRGKPALVCLDYGVDEAQHFFNRRDLNLNIGNRQVHLSVSRVFVDEFRMKVWNHNFHYQIRNWLPFNQENYRTYQNMKDENERRIMLERILTGNILSFAKGIKWHITEQVNCHITKIEAAKIIPFKDQRLSAFDLSFETNIFIPDDLGLGKGVSKGYGVLRRVREKNAPSSESKQESKPNI